MSLPSEILLLLIEKGLLAVVLLVAGFWAQRLIEKYRGKQQLHAEIARKRVERIGVVWDEISKFETMVFHIPWRIGAIYLDELRSAGAKDLPEAAPEKADDLLILVKNGSRYIATIGDSADRVAAEKAVTAKIRARLHSEVVPLIEEANSQSDFTSKTISGNRFWLGDGLHTAYRRHYHRVVDVLKHLDFEVGSTEIFKLTMKELEKSREDVGTLLVKLAKRTN